MARLRRWLRGTLALVLLLALLLLYAWSEETGIGRRERLADSDPVSVRDGDTLLIGKDAYRLFSIDAPEYHQSCTSATGVPWPCGREARSKLEALAKGAGLGCTPRARDRFGRAVATCRTATIADIGAAMVAAGLAIDYGGHGEGDYAAEQDDARAARRGIWQGEFTEPAIWRAAHPRGDGD